MKDVLDEHWVKSIEPKVFSLYKCINEDIFNCIKKERRNYGTVVKRFGNWANFINEKIELVQLTYDEKYLFRKILYYRNKFICEYRIKWE